MDNSNFNYQIPFTESIGDFSKFHFSPIYFLGKETTRKRPYHGYSSSPIIEKEYQQISRDNNIKREKSIINLTSEELKKEYSKKNNYLNSGIKNTFILSISLIFNTFLELKFLGPSETNVAILIMCCISVSFCFILLINIKGKVLLDSYGYIYFYLLSMVESGLLLCLFVFKFTNFLLVFNNLNSRDSCRNRYKCPGYFIYLLLLIVNIIIFLGFLFCSKFIFTLFCDGFNILILKKKTIFQRQIDLDEKEKIDKDRKIEFSDENDESMNNTLKELNTSNMQ